MRTKYKLAVVIDKAKKIMNYTCPDCGHRNRHLWFGRSKHHCSECEYITDIKGAQ